MKNARKYTKQIACLIFSIMTVSEALCTLKPLNASKNINSVPPEIIHHIAKYLDFDGISSLRLTSSSLHKILLQIQLDRLFKKWRRPFSKYDSHHLNLINITPRKSSRDALKNYINKTFSTEDFSTEDFSTEDSSTEDSSKKNSFHKQILETIDKDKNKNNRIQVENIWALLRFAAHKEHLTPHCENIIPTSDQVPDNFDHYVSAILLNDDHLLMGCNNTLKIWNLDNHEDPYLINTAQNTSSSTIDQIKKLANNRLALSYSDNKAFGASTMEVWDIQKPDPSKPDWASTCIAKVNYSGEDINIIIQLKDGRLVVSCDAILKVLDINLPEDKYCVAKLEGHEKNIVSITQLTDGRLVSASSDYTLKVWDLKQLENNRTCCIATLTEHSRSVLAVMQMSDGRLVSASNDCTLKVWDLKQLENNHTCCVSTLTGHENGIFKVIQLTNDQLASASHDHTIKVWALGSAKNDWCCISTLNINSAPEAPPNRNIMQLVDGRLVSNHIDNSIRIWDLNRPKDKACVIELKAQPSSTTREGNIIQLNDGRIVSTTYDSISIWNLYHEPEDDSENDS